MESRCDDNMPAVELVRISLPCLMELECNLCINTQTKIVVDHLQGQLVHPLAADLDVGLGVETQPQLPPVHVDDISLLDTLQYLTEWFISVPTTPAQ